MAVDPGEGRGARRRVVRPLLRRYYEKDRNHENISALPLSKTIPVFCEKQ
jgi:hypothetical protein